MLNKALSMSMSMSWVNYGGSVVSTLEKKITLTFGFLWKIIDRDIMVFGSVISLTATHPKFEIYIMRPWSIQDDMNIQTIFKSQRKVIHWPHNGLDGRTSWQTLKRNAVILTIFKIETSSAANDQNFTTFPFQWIACDICALRSEEFSILTNLHFAY